MEGFQQRYAELKDLGAHVVGVSSDTWATQGVFASDLELDFPLLSDWPNYETIAAFGVGRESGPTARRVTFVFDVASVLREVLDEDREMEAHSEGAVEAVKRLQAG